MKSKWYRNLLILATLSLLFIFIGGSKTFAATESKLLSSDETTGDRFGQSVSFSGNMAIVGTPMDDNYNGANSGSVSVFAYISDTWRAVQKLIASDGNADDYFGISVSINGDVAIVGAQGNDDNGNSSGAAYIFRLEGNTWIEEQKLLASDGESGDYFGHSVSINGDVAIVGAYREKYNSWESGAAYVFRFDGSNWVQEQKLIPSSRQYYSDFGVSVSIIGDVAIVGASGYEYNGAASGASYVFRFDGSNWVEEQRLLYSGGADSDHFGCSVSISGDVAIVGASGEDYLQDDAGAAHVFRFDGTNWWEEQRLGIIGATQDDNFGNSVSISGDVAIVGARNDIFYEGSAYVFRFDGTNWVEEQKFLASDRASLDHFGTSVFISGDTAIVGAPYKDEEFNNVGSAYVFRFDGSTWEEEQKLSNPDRHESDHFGYSVSISGDGNVVIVGEHSNIVGSATIYSWDGTSWVEEQKLVPSDSPDWSGFGVSVSISGDGAVAIVGAAHDNAAYIFRWNGSSWVEEQKLLASDRGGLSDSFGHSVSISGDVAIVGANWDWGDDDLLNGVEAHGSAYIFRWNGSSWVEEQKLIPSDFQSGGFFGQFVSISGNVAIVGDPDKMENGDFTGAAYVFRFNGSNWVEEQKLLCSDPTGGSDDFGISGSLSGDGDVAIVGAVGYLESAYIFRWNGSSWVEEQKLKASDLSYASKFGCRVSLSGDGNSAIVGAYRSRNPSLLAGAAYIFRFDGSNWVEEQKLMASDQANGDEFGISVSLSEDGDVAIVGAEGDDNDNGVDSGSAYVYKYLICPVDQYTFFGAAPNDNATACMRDFDGDGYGDSSPPVGVTAGTDGDDSNPAVYPGATEICDGADNDCDGSIDEGLTQPTTCGVGACASTGLMTCSAGSWVGDTCTPGTPVPESCDGIDNDCDGSIDEGLTQTTNCGVGECASTGLMTCNAGSWSPDTCTPGTPVPEICDGKDNDCDGVIDNGPDADGDGVSDCLDNCPQIANDSQLDTDSDAVGDACDNCDAIPNPGQSDIDQDTKGDLCDQCASDPTDQCNTGGSGAGEVDPNDGGSITTPSGDLTIVVPPGAVDDPITCSVTQTNHQDEDIDLLIGPSPGLGVAVAVYDLEPDGQQFDPSVTVTVTADVTHLNQNQRDKLGLYLWDESVGKFVLVDNSVCNIIEDPTGTFNKECTAELDHFSLYGMIAPRDTDKDGIFDQFGDEQDYCPTLHMQDTISLDYIGNLLLPVDGQTGLSTAEAVAVLYDESGAELPSVPVSMHCTDGNGTPYGSCTAETDETGIATCNFEDLGPGVYALEVVSDKLGCPATSTKALLALYDPSAGFVTGGGWIDSPAGAYPEDLLLTGKAAFGFVSKYKKGATTPTGVTEFQFKVADLTFHSNSYEWLVIAGAKAMYKGVGTINGDGEYKFILYAIDADINSNDAFEVDRFRIKIWYEVDDTEYVVYDNGLGSEDDMDITEIGGGSIVIHTDK